VKGSRRIAALVGLRLPLVLPENPSSLPTTPGYSPLLRFGTADHELSVLIAEHMRRQRHGRFLDVGGGTGSSSRHLAGRYEYAALDIVAETDDVILADICDCPDVPDGSFDIVFSWNTYEHLPRPWRAAAETTRILKRGGLALVSTCFAWRFHPVPGD
jgi:ubiquinone/menaquinone biosynthesis C-methylase UbiE